MIVKAPDNLNVAIYRQQSTVFLAGAIDMGKAILWQDAAANALDSPYDLILNPRRSCYEWDYTAAQDRSDPQFRTQVNWELDGLRLADIVFVFFPASSKSPITFMELGLFYKKAVVCVEPGFYRKGNIDIVCERYLIPKFEDFNVALRYTKSEMEKK